MKTLIIYNEIGLNLQYLIAEGDFSRFSGICINSMINTGFEEEFFEWFYDPVTGDEKFKMSCDISLVENKEWDKVAVVTFLP